MFYEIMFLLYFKGLSGSVTGEGRRVIHLDIIPANLQNFWLKVD